LIIKNISSLYLTTKCKNVHIHYQCVLSVVHLMFHHQ
jgi:hypothetical protein